MKRFLKSWGSTILLCFSIVFLKVAVIDFVKVEGMSMYPTLNDKDRLVIEKISRYNNTFKRGDIVILNSHREDEDSNINQYWVKRIVALQGDTVECKNGKLFVNNEEVKEDYILDDIKTYNIVKTTVPKGRLYVLGDNRMRSSDSRVIGCISVDDILGKVIYNAGNIEIFNKE